MKINKMAVLALTVVTACGGGLAPASQGSIAIPVADGAYTTINPAELSEMLEHKDFLFVNVHVPYQGEIEQTDAFIAYEGDGPQRVSEYPADKSARIVVYCRSGHMSTIVAGELVKAGYTNVWELQGGMVAWEEAGLPIIKK
jgi:rhodanese-related sulfurtransferase